MVAVACGAWHSLALSRTGNAYGWGWNRHGQLGGGAAGAEAATLVPAPRLLRLPGGGNGTAEEEDVEIEQVSA